MSKFLAIALACLGLPALAQTTTTVTSQPQQQANPPPQQATPPSSTSTTVTTQSQPQPPPPSTQVVVNPNDPNYVPPPPPRTPDDVSGVAAAPSGRSAVAIVATDAVYGGVAGGVIGGGVTLIDQGNNWARNLMVGAGVGILAGAAYGVYESATQTPPRRAVADADPANSNVNGTAFTALAGRF